MTALDLAPPPPDAPDLDKPGSLRPVIRVVPPEAYDNPTWKGLAYFFRDLAVYGLAIWGLIVVDNPFAVVALWILAALAVSALFIVGSRRSPRRVVQEQAAQFDRRPHRDASRVARLRGLATRPQPHPPLLTVREGFDFVWHPYTPEQYAAMSWPKRLRHRFEWSWLGAGAYYSREVWWHKMMVGKPPAPLGYRDPPRPLHRAGVHRGLRDRPRLVGLGALGNRTRRGMDDLQGARRAVPRLQLHHRFAGARASHPARHPLVATPQWTKFKGQMEGTTILRAPKGLDFFFHWIMVHIPHHVDMRIPMYNLELAADAIKAAYPDIVHDEPLRFGDFVANTKQCKVYDFEAHEWLTYTQASKRLTEAEPMGEASNR